MVRRSGDLGFRAITFHFPPSAAPKPPFAVYWWNLLDSEATSGFSCIREWAGQLSSLPRGKLQPIPYELVILSLLKARGPHSLPAPLCPQAAGPDHVSP